MTIVIAPNTTRIGDTAITIWKCATTNMVSESGRSTGTLPRNRPVNPPLINVKTKPMANSMGTVRWMFPRHSVSTQL